MDLQLKGFAMLHRLLACTVPVLLVALSVVDFVTPVGAITRADMVNVAKAFAAWDRQAIRGGSFVVKEK